MKTEAEKAAEAAEALNAIPVPVGDDWLKVSMAYKAAGGDFASWDAWCKSGENYNEAENKMRWDSFTPGAIKAGTLYHYARLAGWMPTRREAPVYVGAVPIAKQAPKKRTPPPMPGRKAAVAEYIKEALKHAGAATEYLKKRGIENAPEGFQFGFDAAKQGVVIVYPGENFYVIRNTAVAQDGKGEKPKYEYPAGITKPVFNASAFDEDTAYLTEGQIDAITLTLAGFPAAACNTPAAVVEALQGRNVQTIYYVADDDAPGQKKAQEITEAIKRAGVEAHAISVPAHDVNAFFLDAYTHAAKGEEEASAIEALKKAINEARAEAAENERRERAEALEDLTAGTVAAHIARLRERCKNPIPPISTGFKTLDDLLDGGFRAGELAVLGGVASGGKTTIAMQFIDHAAAEGIDCIVFSSEMSEYDLVARSVSRESCEARHAGISDCKWDFSQREVQDEAQYMEPGRQNQLKALENAWKSYTAYSGYITIVQNNRADMTPSFIRDYVQRYCEITGRKPFILVDYLQNLKPEGDAEAKRANTDSAISILKSIAIDNELPVLVISSLNRENYGKPLNFAAFKESGGIEYTAELLMGLQFHCVHEIEGKFKQNGEPYEAIPPFRLKAEKDMPIRDVEITLLKQRGGMPGGYCRFDYDAEHNCFFNDEPYQDASPDRSAALAARAQKDGERLAKGMGLTGDSAPAEAAQNDAEAPSTDETKSNLAEFKAKKAAKKAAKAKKQ